MLTKQREQECDGGKDRTGGLLSQTSGGPGARAGVGAGGLGEGRGRKAFPEASEGVGEAGIKPDRLGVSRARGQRRTACWRGHQDF